VDLLDLLESRITPEIRRLASERILDGGNLATRSDLSAEVVKITLQVVANVSPFTVFKQAEAALIYGINPKTVPTRTEANTPNRVNVGKG
jgi:hypothetical protein